VFQAKLDSFVSHIPFSIFDNKLLVEFGIIGDAFEVLIEQP
jgi:hypothetical protein